MWPVGVSSVNMSLKCMWMDRSSPPGVTHAYAAAALWVQSDVCFGYYAMFRWPDYMVFHIWSHLKRIVTNMHTKWCILQSKSSWYLQYQLPACLIYWSSSSLMLKRSVPVSYIYIFIISSCAYLLGRWSVLWAYGFIMSHATLQPSS